jgi:hypothetical protein
MGTIRQFAANWEGCYKQSMTPGTRIDEFKASLALAEPPRELPAPLAALWWDAKGDWARAHGIVDDLSTRDAMAVHAYLHRKEGVEWNADYWYSRAGLKFHRPTLEAEWQALVDGLL